MEKRKINDDEFVKQQYKDDKGLLIRKNLHRKYSVNKQGFSNWLFDIMEIPSVGKILELGSGNGDFWRKNIKELNDSSSLVLSDYSEGMVELMRSQYDNVNVDIMQIDIQDIPFANESFDIVIANAMLYHIPELEKALCEVNRVLKPSGTFYASTFGENGLSEFIINSLTEIGIKTSKDSTNTFTLQNGFTKLSNHFGSVTRLNYEDKLIVTDFQDLIEYIFSMTSMNFLEVEDRERVHDYFEKLVNDKGQIEIPKEYGSFVSSK